MKDKKKQSKPVLTIIGFKDDKDVLWKKLKCKCAQDPNDVEHRYPMLRTCKFCKYTHAQNSVPREPFEVVYEGKKVLITKITIKRGKDDDILGWIF